jgi:hypothetical protein
MSAYCDRRVVGPQGERPSLRGRNLQGGKENEEACVQTTAVSDLAAQVPTGRLIFGICCTLCLVWKEDPPPPRRYYRSRVVEVIQKLI